MRRAMIIGPNLVVANSMHEMRSVRGALAGLRLIGSGNPPLHRFRVGLEFALSGHRDLDEMITQHALMARLLADRLVISPKTDVDHVEHIYAKIDASTRTSASLFAMQHGLLAQESIAA